MEDWEEVSTEGAGRCTERSLLALDLEGSSLVVLPSLSGYSPAAPTAAAALALASSIVEEQLASSSMELEGDERVNNEDKKVCINSNCGEIVLPSFVGVVAELIWGMHCS